MPMTVQIRALVAYNHLTVEWFQGYQLTLEQGEDRIMVCGSPAESLESCVNRLYNLAKISGLLF